jgi:nicotinamidase-related amidase
MLEISTIMRDDTVLLIIDIQERLVPTMAYGEQVIQNTNLLIEAADTFSLPVILTEQYPKGLGKTVAEINTQAVDYSVFEKISFSGFTSEVASNLIEIGRKKIIVTGMETHVCVFQTVRDLLGQGYQVFVAADAVCSRRTLNYKNGLALMSKMGAVVTNTETLLFDLLQESGTPEFKRLSKLIK